ncbi:MAG: GAF domain-containing protein [Brevinematales bacterium]|nr:GAF domain-containing protein [Brevinematales bacterium]
MNMVKKIFIFLLDFLIILFISLWIYLLYIEFTNLPKNTDMLKFSIFQIKLTLFTLFLISSIAFLWWTTAKNEKIDLNPIQKELENIKKIIPEVKKEQQIEITDYSLEIDKILDSKNLDELFNNLFKLLKKNILSERISIEFYDFKKEKLFIYQKTDFQLKEEIEDKNPLSYFVFKNEKRLYVTNIETHPVIGRKNKQIYNKKSFIILPIKIIGKTFGIINISEKKSEDGIFSIEEFEKASFITSIFSQRLENMILYLSIEDLINKKAW